MRTDTQGLISCFSCTFSHENPVSDYELVKVSDNEGLGCPLRIRCREKTISLATKMLNQKDSTSAFNSTPKPAKYSFPKTSYGDQRKTVKNERQSGLLTLQ